MDRNRNFLTVKANKIGKWKEFFQRISGHVALPEIISRAEKDGIIQEEERKILFGTLSLKDLDVQDIMTPRSQMEAVSVGMSLKETTMFIAEAAYSRIPVFKDTKDTVVGILYVRDILVHVLDVEKHNRSIGEYTRKPFFISEDQSVLTLLEEFKKKRCHVAIVQDEYGGTSGIVTVNDVIEPIVGRLDDEYDEIDPDQEIRKISDKQYVVHGQMPIAELEKIGVFLHSNVVDTLGGYLANIAGYIPSVGEKFSVEGYTFVILRANRKQIRSIEICIDSE
ncbi:MAG: hemolysin family protein [Desulfovibrionaceae bacterium]